MTPSSSHFAVLSVLVVVVSLVTGCGNRHGNMPAPVGDHSIKVQEIRRWIGRWDSTTALVHPDGSSTVVLDLRRVRSAKHGDAMLPISERCVLVARGAPYVDKSRGIDIFPNYPAFAAFQNIEPNFDRAEIEQSDPCQAALGSDWRLPLRSEFEAYAPRFVSGPQSWFVRRPDGGTELVDFTPSVMLPKMPPEYTPTRFCSASSTRGLVQCVARFSAPPEPREPTLEEIDLCVRRQFRPSTPMATSVDIPEHGLQVLLAVRHACRNSGPKSEWARILRDVDDKLGELAGSIVGIADDPRVGPSPGPLEPAVEMATREFLQSLLESIQSCLESPLHKGQPDPALLARVRTLRESVSDHLSNADEHTAQ